MPSSFFDSIDDLPITPGLPDNVTKLLSASSYPHIPSNISTSGSSGAQLYGGIMAAAESAEEDEFDDRPKKRSKADKNDDLKDGDNSKDAPKRQRGRPKVSTKDETAAERRRTQIRLAQRAYRNRKENTIIELTQKVETLQATMKAVGAGISRLRDSLLNNGMIHVDSVIVEQFDGLVQQLADPLDPTSDADKGSEGEDSEPHSQDSSYNQQHYGVIGGHNVPVTLQGQTLPASSGPAIDIQSNLLGIEVDHSTLEFSEQNLTDFQRYPALPTNFPMILPSKALTASSNNHQASTSIDRFPYKHSYTYSFQETTFARRLHRLCIERAFHKITSPHVDPDWLLKTFRLTFGFSNKQRIIAGFRAVLSRGADEPLENWRSPFVHIGGAGLHYPRRDANGRPIYPPNLIDPMVVASPWRIPNVETPMTSTDLEEILEYIGFGGEWFDSHDVEEYLKTKGIFPDPQSSFVTVDTALVGLVAPVEVGTVTSGSSPRSYQSGHVSQTREQAQEQHNIGDAGQASAQLQSIPLADNTIDNWLGQQEPYTENDFNIEFTNSMFETAARETKMLTIEIERFLERLSDESVCLGRAPGFRKEHVDNALALAMQEAF